ncbi:conserved hypothetical protein [Hyella patelloides LEGE 07179]|uniref:PEP-CTERM/exosortase system-associated acyltransferase n=1 Tax=Hyella patelloides LEGE 07179 TaxID=945734 RepID=A0A563VYK0_9CYAN|nr:PEP-CTERM/exosortase system-associated acyltransferase [Hyella patelloides]VEP16532.1 conserved hypothetical protein [Hyella patelloides LEGE 07179]
MSFDICQHFSQYFSLLVADNQSLLQEVYKIRYQVYCEELNYESPENFPDGMETDIYDSHSIHCLLQHKPTGVYAGCVRIIIPQQESDRSTFPWQKFASNLVYPSPEYNWQNICEISRLAVLKDFRKRKGDDTIPTGTILPDVNGGKRRFPLIAMSLYWAAFCLALNLELDIFAIMEPRLARHLRRCGLQYCMISELFEHHGKRAIFHTKPPELLGHLDVDTYRFFAFLNSTIAQQLSQAKYISSPFMVPQQNAPAQVAFIN